mmetsp:Transcript_11277/g.21277  ORF Transcript_11277/g.21277 Transcript_11277/m.21277 type:complete len:260 (+) Transcript_11277:622-1401(+)
MTRRGRRPRMLVPFRDSTCSASSTSPLPRPSRMVWTRRVRRRTSSFSTLVVEPSMFPSSPSRRASSRSRPRLVTPTWEVRISITAWLTTSSKTSSVVTARTCLKTSVLFVVSVLLANVRSVLYRVPPRLTLRLTPSLTVSISTRPSPVLVSRISAWTTLRSAWIPARRCCVIPRFRRIRSMRLYLWEDPRVSPRSSPCLLSSSTARSHASLSTLTRLLPLEPLSRLPSCLELTSQRSSLSSCCWMLHPSHLVLRPRVVS